MFKRKDGFTFAELLIVVAIIAVLVAISIPVFTGQLKKARLATNEANARSAYAAARAEFMIGDMEFPALYIYDLTGGLTEIPYDSDTTYLYTVENIGDWATYYIDNEDLTSKIAPRWKVIFWDKGADDTYYKTNIKPLYD